MGNISETNKKFDTINFCYTQLKAGLLGAEEENGLTVQGGNNPIANNYIIFSKVQTEGECDYIKDSEGKTCYPIQWLMVLYGDNYEQARNRAKRLIKNNYEDIVEEKKESLPGYLLLKDNGNIKVKVGLLAAYIEANSNYYIVKKQGAESNFIYWYKDGYYQLTSSNEVKAKIKEFIPLEAQDTNIVNNVYGLLMATDNFIPFEAMNDDEIYINFKNGLLNTKTWKLEEHNPKYRHTFQLKCNYNPDAAEPTLWKNYIKTLTSGDLEMADLLRQWFGLNISNYNTNKTKKVMGLTGNGDVGKTIYIMIMQSVLGGENVSNTKLQKLSSRFGASSLYGTIALIIDDQSSEDLEDSSIIKSITGGGRIEVEIKGKTAFSFKYPGGATFTCNRMPYIKDDKGNHMFERFLVVPCTNVIPEEKRDRLLSEKLEKEIEGIALWALKGLKKVLENNFKLPNPKVCQEANDEWRQRCDGLYRFIKENFDITREQKDSVDKKDFENFYERYCTHNDIVALKKGSIKECMLRYEFKCIPKSGYPHYRGLTLKLSANTY